MRLYTKTFPDPEIGDPYHLSLDKQGTVISAVFTCTGIVSVLTTATLPDGSPVYDTVQGIHTISTSTDLLDLHTRLDVADNTVYIFYIANEQFVDPPVNIFAQTLPTRAQPGTIAEKEGYATIFGIGIPSVASTSTDYMFAVVSTGSQLTLTGDIELSQNSMTSYQQGMHRLILGAPSYNTSTQLLSIPLSAGTSTNGGGTLGTGAGLVGQDPIDNTVPLTVYVSTTVGNLLQNKVPLVNGTATIYISLAGYPSGMTGKVKTAFKYWTRKAVTYFTTP